MTWGIGTTQPAARLEVNSGDLLLKAAAEDPGDILFQSAAGVQKARIWSQPAAGTGLFLSSGDNNPDISISAAGNVGVGTAQPTAKLEVDSGDLLLKAAAEDPGDILFQSAAGVQKARIWSQPAAGTGLFLSSGDNNPDISISAAGNVGVGTAQPTAKLEVNSGDLLLKAAAEDPGDILFQSAAGVQKARIWSQPAAGTGLFLSSGDNNPDISISAAGNVGVGTAQPTAKLEVNSGDLLLKAAAEDPGDILFQSAAGVQKARIWSQPAAGTGLFLSSGDNNPDISINAAGNVGMGTNNPVARCEIVSGGPDQMGLGVRSIRKRDGGRGWRQRIGIRCGWECSWTRGWCARRSY